MKQEFALDLSGHITSMANELMPGPQQLSLHPLFFGQNIYFFKKIPFQELGQLAAVPLIGLDPIARLNGSHIPPAEPEA